MVMDNYNLEYLQSTVSDDLIHVPPVSQNLSNFTIEKAIRESYHKALKDIPIKYHKARRSFGLSVSVNPQQELYLSIYKIPVWRAGQLWKQ